MTVKLAAPNTGLEQLCTGAYIIALLTGLAFVSVAGVYVGVVRKKHESTFQR